MQAVVLALLIHHGWYYNDDFALLMNASHRSLGWNYLRTPINDHLLPGERLEFWLLRHTAPLNHPLTIAIRLALQGLCSWLLLRLLGVLVGRRPLVLLIGLLYALCPLVLTNCLWLTVALSLLPAQALVLAMLLAHVRYTATGRLRWAAAAGACLLASALFWEKAAVSAVLLPILSLGYLHDGSFGRRLGAALRRWPGWLLTGLPLAVFVGYFLHAGYGGARQSVPAGDLARVLWLQWSEVLAPSLFGGPWRWFDFPGVSLGYARSSTASVIVVQLGVAVLVLAGLRLIGPRSLVGWLLPLLPLIIGTSVVAFGRFQAFGVLIATTLRYGADLAVPLFLGLALALLPTSGAAIAGRVTGPGGRTGDEAGVDAAGATVAGRPRHRSRRVLLRPAGIAAALLWLVGSGLSTTSFDRHWGANPTHAYVRTLTAGIAEAGPTLNLYDTTVSQQVLPIFFGPHWHLSDFLPLTGRVPVLDGPGTEPQIADDAGRLRPAALVPSATRGPPAGGLCTYLIQGAGTFTIPFTTPAPEGDGFLRIDYLQPRPSTATVSVTDTRGARHDPVAGSRVLFGYTLSHVTLRLPVTSVAAVVVHTTGPDTHLCIGRLTVGAPFPVGGSR